MSRGRVAGHQWHRRTCFPVEGVVVVWVEISVRGRRAFRGWGAEVGGAVRVGGGLSQAEKGLAALLGWSCWVRLMSTSCNVKVI